MMTTGLQRVSDQRKAGQVLGHTPGRPNSKGDALLYFVDVCAGNIFDENDIKGTCRQSSGLSGEPSRCMGPAVARRFDLRKYSDLIFILYIYD